MTKTYSVVLVLASAALAGANSILDPSNGVYYDFATTGFISWDNAEAQATSSHYNGLTGQLAVVTNSQIDSFLANKLGGTGWIGLVKAPGVTDPNTGWSWVTGAPFVYTNWNPGEPNDNQVQGIENRAQMYGNGYWNDLNQNPTQEPNGTNGYYVQYATPEPPTGLCLGLGVGAVGLAFRRRTARKSRPKH